MNLGQIWGRPLANWGKKSKNGLSVTVSTRTNDKNYNVSVSSRLFVSRAQDII